MIVGNGHERRVYPASLLRKKIKTEHESEARYPSRQCIGEYCTYTQECIGQQVRRAGQLEIEVQMEDSHDYSNRQDEKLKAANRINDERSEAEDGICDGKNTPYRRWVNGNYAHSEVDFIAAGGVTVGNIAISLTDWPPAILRQASRNGVLYSFSRREISTSQVSNASVAHSWRTSPSIKARLNRETEPSVTIRRQEGQDASFFPCAFVCNLCSPHRRKY
jgi:hypothetical protein